MPALSVRYGAQSSLRSIDSSDNVAWAIYGGNVTNCWVIPYHIDHNQTWPSSISTNLGPSRHPHEQSWSRKNPGGDGMR